MVAASLGLAVSGALTAGASAAVPQGLWLMDETSGTTMVDSSGNGNDGTTTNVQMTGQGYVFNGTSSKVVVPDSPTLNPGSADFSFTMTVQSSVAPAAGKDYDLIRKGIATTAGGQYKMEVVAANGAGKAFCYLQDAAGVVAKIRGTTNVTDGQPHTITCSRTGSSVTLQVDGLAPKTASVSALGSMSNTRPLTIGVKSTTVTGPAGDWYNGLVSGASVSVGSVSGPPPEPTPNATLDPVADSWVGSDYPKANHGTATDLKVDATPVKIAYLKFDLSGLAGKTVSGAWLQVTTSSNAGSGSSLTQTVRSVADTSWTESGLTYLNHPALGSELASISGTSAGKTYKIALPAGAVQDGVGGLYSLAVDSAADDVFSVTSRESASAPRLLVTTS